jgi:hypothetical protein
MHITICNPRKTLPLPLSRLIQYVYTVYIYIFTSLTKNAFENEWKARTVLSTFDTVTHLSPSNFHTEGAWPTRQSETETASLEGGYTHCCHPSCCLGTSGQFSLTAAAVAITHHHPEYGQHFHCCNLTSYHLSVYFYSVLPPLAIAIYTDLKATLLDLKLRFMTQGAFALQPRDLCCLQPTIAPVTVILGAHSASEPNTLPWYVPAHTFLIFLV